MTFTSGSVEVNWEPLAGQGTVLNTIRVLYAHLFYLNGRRRQSDDFFIQTESIITRFVNCFEFNEAC